MGWRPVLLFCGEKESFCALQCSPVVSLLRNVEYSVYRDQCPGLSRGYSTAWIVVYFHLWYSALCVTGWWRAGLGFPDVPGISRRENEDTLLWRLCRKTGSALYTLMPRFLLAPLARGNVLVLAE